MLPVLGNLWLQCRDYDNSSHGVFALLVSLIRGISWTLLLLWVIRPVHQPVMSEGSKSLLGLLGKKEKVIPIVLGDLFMKSLTCQQPKKNGWATNCGWSPWAWCIGLNRMRRVWEGRITPILLPSRMLFGLRFCFQQSALAIWITDCTFLSMVISASA